MTEPKKLTASNVDVVGGLMDGLAAYHNAIADDFAGAYPSLSKREHLAQMAAELESGNAMLAVVLEDGVPMGYCNCTITHSEIRTSGLLAQLYVDASCRGKGYGGLLMRAALEYFQENKVTLTDTRVVVGNKAVDFYAKYGFKPRIVVLSRED